ncbi:hypothetical protein PISMIDRAFT_678515 [Pisolithus microcarpus 441]|uniref:Uncharacterized protein n=1 Tax=Pisolithus microcarpus 441 TaxID=765257 RepID=A0A0C9YGJ4_9AGAM|nr:hypothetical protein PISMIDRAFT_678515 [Pisolithus microcarpus 441]
MPACVDLNSTYIPLSPGDVVKRHSAGCILMPSKQKRPLRVSRGVDDGDGLRLPVLKVSDR